MELATGSVYWGATLLIGGIAGLIFARAWRWGFPSGVQSRFWRSLSSLTQQLLVVDEVRAFLTLYKRLALTLGGYLGRNLGVMMLGGAVLVIAVLAGVYPLQAAWDARIDRLKASDATVDDSVQKRDGQLVYTIDGAPVSIPANDPSARVAVCWSEPMCTALEISNFEIVRLPITPKSLQSPVVIRADHDDVNPFYPYVSDLEIGFLLAFSLAMTLGVVLPGKRSAKEEVASDDVILHYSDFALVQINEQLKPVIRRLGDLETRVVRRRLVPLPVDQPIFITGLARSGTTVLLNALVCCKEVGSHQYRDFPFLAAPVVWNALQGAIAKSNVASERPHKDRILITKQSPEAFEEPLWQYFFPHVHDTARNQRLTARTSHPKFEAFFVDHLRKILYLRKASRYVSKGNYNIGRLEYLIHLFPDARFIIPVRAPLDHVASLVRQHQLFTRYSAADPRVPLYLAAAGHYEFGPQRRPIYLSEEGVGAIEDAWRAGDDALGYARQWAEVYGHVARLKASGSALADRIRIVQYEAFCAQPLETLEDILAECRVSMPRDELLEFCGAISLSDAPIPDSVLDRRAEIDAAVAGVAPAYGYDQSRAPSAVRA